MNPARGVPLVALAFALGACGDTAPPAPVPVPVGPATVEVLSPGTYRLDGEFVDGAALADAFATAGRGRTDRISDPLRIIVPASLEIGDAMPAVVASLQPPGRVNLTLRVIENGAGRETTLPVLTGCMCRAVHIIDGDSAPLQHDSGAEYVFVTARIDEDGSISTHATEFDAPGAPHDAPLPARLPPGAPTEDAALDVAALGTWFDALQSVDVQPLLCLDYRDTLPVGHLVDALIVTKHVLGRRVLLGPNPREPEVEEGLEEDRDDD